MQTPLPGHAANQPFYCSNCHPFSWRVPYERTLHQSSGLGAIIKRYIIVPRLLEEEQRCFRRRISCWLCWMRVGSHSARLLLPIPSWHKRIPFLSRTSITRWAIKRLGMHAPIIYSLADSQYRRSVYVSGKYAAHLAFDPGAKGRSPTATPRVVCSDHSNLCKGFS